NAQQVLANADIEGTVAAAAQAQYGPDGADLISEAAWLRVRDAIAADSSLLEQKKDFWLPASSPLDLAARGEGTPALKQQVTRLRAAHALERGFNALF